MTRHSVYVAVAGLGLLSTAVPSLAGELECRSSGHRYQYCPADTRNNVQLAQQLSSSACRYGSSWGYDQRGVWVDNGCAGMFTYGGGSSGSGHHRDSGGNVAAGVAAAVILGALISANSGEKSSSHADNRYPVNNPDSGVNVPAWAVGHFAGPDRSGGPDIEIAVDPNGRINGMQGSSIFSGQMRGTEAWLGNRSYSVVRTGDGIRLAGEGRSGYDLRRQ
ncbi:MAG TPA: DUF3011 domain-containing protein [Rubrivivax sp.]|nr:DUF3011 domain-containing protein [Rubrivivax sp.]